MAVVDVDVVASRISCEFSFNKISRVSVGLHIFTALASRLSKFG